MLIRSSAMERRQKDDTVICADRNDGETVRGNERGLQLQADTADEMMEEFVRGEDRLRQAGMFGVGGGGKLLFLRVSPCRRRDEQRPLPQALF